MQQRRQQQHQSQRLFTATELADFEYCPLLWWHEQFESAVQEDTEELFARLVELEQEHETLAPSIPEYQLIEQLLVRRNAFEPEDQLAEYNEDENEDDRELEKREEERIPASTPRIFSRRLFLILLGISACGLLFMLVSVVLR